VGDGLDLDQPVVFGGALAPGRSAAFAALRSIASRMMAGLVTGRGADGPPKRT